MKVIATSCLLPPKNNKQNTSHLSFFGKTPQKGGFRSAFGLSPVAHCNEFRAVKNSFHGSMLSKK